MNIQEKILATLFGTEELAEDFFEKMVDAEQHGTEENIKERAVKAWQYLSEYIHDNSDVLDFEDGQNNSLTELEMLFYLLVFYSYCLERNVVEPEIDILPILKSLGDEKDNRIIQYLNCIYETMQIMFQAYLTHINAWELFCNDYKPWLQWLTVLPQRQVELREFAKEKKCSSIGEAYSLYYQEKFERQEGEDDCFFCRMKYCVDEGGHYSSSQMERFPHIEAKLQEALHIYPKGEIANRLMLISDAIMNCGIKRKSSTPDFSAFDKYTHLRKDFITDCFTPITGMTNIVPFATMFFDFSPEVHIVNINGVDVFGINEQDDQDQHAYRIMSFRHFMCFPACIPLSAAENSIPGIKPEPAFNPIIVGSNLHKQNIQLEEKNKALKKAQDDKKQIIAEFAHTYGNMRATTLQDIGTELLSTDDDLLHEWGRKVMVEYAIKENLTKEVEMLKLQFEDETTALIQKLQASASNMEGKDIADLISDSLQRCFMSILYGETKPDKRKRELFFGTDDYDERREVLQQSFEQDVLIDQTDMLTWIREKQLLNITVNVSGLWEGLWFDNGGYAALLITNWITELLSNAMKYADKSKPISLSFGQQDDLLVLEICNTKEKAVRNVHNTQQGISSICASIRRLNLAVNENSETDYALDQSDDTYHLQLYLSSKILIE